jgi:hypothetical protein
MVQGGAWGTAQDGDEASTQAQLSNGFDQVSFHSGARVLLGGPTTFAHHVGWEPEAGMNSAHKC